MRKDFGNETCGERKEAEGKSRRPLELPPVSIRSE